MEIEVTTKRECCQKTDLKLLGDLYTVPNANVYFCLYCGKRWMKGKRPDAAGGMENFLLEENFDLQKYCEYHLRGLK